MQNLFKFAILPMMVSAGALLWGAGAPVNAATFVNLGNAAGVQCTSYAVNDSGQSVGNCSQDDPSANDEPWYAASTAGPQQILPSLVANQPCAVGAIANNGSLLGSCADATGRNFAVTWSAATPNGAPTKLTPLPATFLIPLLRPADLQTVATAQNQQGAALGLSISGAGAATVVLYMPGIATPLRISGWGDMCRGVVVNNAAINGYPSLLLKCPVNGKPVARVFTRGASAYSFTDLPLASGASACWGVGMNDLNQVVGTCTFPTTPHQSRKAAFWPSPASAPRLLTLPSRANNSGVAVNNAGHVLARGMAPTGFTTDFFWADTTTNFGVRPIAFLPGSVSTQAFSLAENDTVAMDCTNSNQYITACTWDPTRGTVSILSNTGGLKSTLTAFPTVEPMVRVWPMMRHKMTLLWWHRCPERSQGVGYAVEEVEMKRTAVFFALLMGSQVLATSMAYAGGIKGGTFYPGGEVGEESVAFFAPLDQAFGSLFPSEKITEAPSVGAIGGKEKNAPSPFKCSGGYKFIHDGPVVRKEFCD